MDTEMMDDDMGKVCDSKNIKHAQVQDRGFPCSSAGEESACNAGDPSLIPGSGGSPGEGINYTLQYSWASVVTHMVKNLPVKQETQVSSLRWEDPLEEGMGIHSSILAWRIPKNRGDVGLQYTGVQSRTLLSN